MSSVEHEPIQSVLVMRALRNAEQIAGVIAMYVISDRPVAETIKGLELLKAEIDRQLDALTGDVPQ